LPTTKAAHAFGQFLDAPFIGKAGGGAPMLAPPRLSERHAGFHERLDDADEIAPPPPASTRPTARPEMNRARRRMSSALPERT
jgi:hypothetical protein